MAQTPKLKLTWKKNIGNFFWKGKYSNDKLIAEKNLLKTKKITSSIRNVNNLNDAAKTWNQI